MSNPDKEALYEAIVYFHADNDVDADALYDGMLDAIGCGDGPDHECPHFRIGFGPYMLGAEGRSSPRRAALRQLGFVARDTLRVLVGLRP